MTTIHTGIDSLSPSEHQVQLRRAVIASTVGTTIEWYDFLIYSTVTGLVFNKVYFPGSDPWIGTLQAFGVYFIGFVARPIGAVIFGHFGAKPLGVSGSAMAQNIGVGFEMLAMIAMAARPFVRRKFNVFDWRWRPAMFRTLLKVGVPSGVQTVSEVLAWSMFLIWVMAPLGTTVMAANTFMIRYMTLSFMPAFGIGIATTALVGAEALVTTGFDASWPIIVVGIIADTLPSTAARTVPPTPVTAAGTKGPGARWVSPKKSSASGSDAWCAIT